MNKGRISNSFILLLGIISSWLTFAEHFGPIAEAACPPTYHNGWAANSTVIYSAVFTGTELNNVVAVLDNWESHNSVSGNCSNVRFSSGLSRGYTIYSDPGQRPGDPTAVAYTTIDGYSFNVVTSAITIFYWGAKRFNGSPAWSRNGTPDYFRFILSTMLHEAGHTMGLDDAADPQVSGQSVMNAYSGTNDSGHFGPTSVQSCDDGSINTISQYRCSISQGGGDPECYYVSGSNGMAPNYYLYPFSGCDEGYSDFNGCCVFGGCPILIDVSGDGFHLAGTDNPVSFDILANGHALPISWAALNSDDAFLVLDRNSNGTIDGGTELFGNHTPQAESQPQNANGFLALAEYDKAANGGNGDGKIDSLDVIFSSLRLWQDLNHNAISEASEMHTLPSLNISAISFDFKESKRTDEYGNRFRYRAKVYDAKGAHAGRWAWDVFFVKQR